MTSPECVLRGDVTTKEVLDGLERIHPDEQGEWLFMREALGIDGLALHCWAGSSKVRYERIGYEVKVSRSDFRREIRSPLKRAGAMRICDRFYFACPEALILAQEVPAGCGLVWVGRTTRRIVAAPLLQPRGLTRHETVRLLRGHLNPPKLQAMKARAARADAIERESRKASEEAWEERTVAKKSLEFFAGHLVSEGQVWVGPFPTRRHWSPGGYVEPLEQRVVVEEVKRYEDGSAGVVVGEEGADRSVPTWTRMVERMSLGAFLCAFRPADGSRVLPVPNAVDVPVS